MKNAVWIGLLVLIAHPQIARAQRPASTPPAKAIDESADEKQSAESLSQEASDTETYNATMQLHRLPRQATKIINSTSDLVADIQELPRLWKSISEDETLRVLGRQLALLYTPKVYYSAYAGGFAESTGYAGVSAGAAVDVTAPLCRYIGAAVNTHGYYLGGTGLSYDARGTVCLPWGPFSLEFGMLRQRDLRVGMTSAPSLANARYSVEGFELRMSGFRWLEPEWEIGTGLTTVVFNTYSVPGDRSIPDSFSYQVDVSVFRFIRYGRGLLGADRQIDAVYVDVAGVQDTKSTNRSTSVMSISALKWSGARLAKGLYLDGHLGFSNGQIKDLARLSHPLANFFYFATGLGLSYGNAKYQTGLNYRRRLVPDSDFRLLSEDRVEMSAQLLRQSDLSSLSIYGALTKQEAAPPGTEAFLPTPSYGVEGKYGRKVVGPFYLQLTATAARSYYASIDGARLLDPQLETRFLASLIAGKSNN